MKMKRLLWAFMMIAALALLAGCGGGGGGTSLMVEGERATQDLIDDLVDERDAALAAIRAVMITLPENATQAQITQAINDAIDARTQAVLNAVAAEVPGVNAGATQAAIITAIMDLGDNEQMALDAIAAEVPGVSAGATQAAIIAAIMDLSDNEQMALNAIAAVLPDMPAATQTAIIAAINDLIPEALPAPTAKTMNVTHAILGSDKPNDPQTYAAIGAMTRPGKATDGDMVHVRAGNTTNATTAAIGVGTATEFTAGFDTLDILGRTEMIADPDDATQMIPNPANFMEVANSEVSLSKGFTSTNYMRSVTNDDDETTTDELAVVTDMKDPGPIAFDAYYTAGNEANRNGVTTVTAGVADDVDTTNVDETKLHVVLGLATTDDFGDLFDAPEFRSTGTGAETLDYGPATVDANEYRRTFAGNFNGIAGTFTCGDVTGGTACQATLVAGKLTSLSGDWRFTPDNAKSMLPGVENDGDFLAFGWWLRSVPVANADDNPYSVGTFATGSVPYTAAMAQRAAVTGTAKYSGPAAGKYARKTLNPDGTVAGLIAGHFTADASLTATFGQTTEADLAPNQLYSIHGYVDDFRDGDGNTIDPAWDTTTGRVNLMKAGFAASGADHNERDSAFTDDHTFGGDTNGNGSWQGRFFGPDVNADNEAIKPSGVAGEFTNHWSNGHVIGAFGATQDE